MARERQSQRLVNTAQRLRSALAARARLARQQNDTFRQRLAVLQQRMQQAGRTLQARRGEKVRALGQVLASLSYRKVLERGFALVRDEHGTPLRGIAAAQAAARLEIEFSDGRLPALPEGRKAAPVRAKARGGGQGDLF